MKNDRSSQKANICDALINVLQTNRNASQHNKMSIVILDF